MKTFVGLFICALIFASWKSNSSKNIRLPSSDISCERKNLKLIGESEAFSVDSLFTAPVNLGASVSAGYNINSSVYGKLIPLTLRLKNRFAPESKMVNMAKPGYDSRSIEAQFFADSISDNLSGASSVVALDLFFWDTSKRKNPECQVEQVQRILSKLRPVPVMLGEVPLLLEGEQTLDCLKSINEQIRTHCLSSENCFVIHLPEAMKRMADSDKKKFFQSDELHLTNDGYAFLEEYVCESMFK